jgi:hypothetical protein
MKLRRLTFGFPLSGLPLSGFSLSGFPLSRFPLSSAIGNPRRKERD